ncbi:ArsR/SmtB family transcription factor [Metallosphaera hakonensis]|uniref:HTH domain-containing protein n=1 Tax=Metallosphaera hakonensis JCM 8857 = DSM 7519 TaxID=1293036 RepID=A0A2U9ISB0_9CREN|nr:winged helix-turn-helix domain-containing protein [Metallosphaera hakonensis]AWR98888.1 ArsR family transcriptional regulator [Metallosphaera hakonensis JCM 8857 = DSM 7519]
MMRKLDEVVNGKGWDTRRKILEVILQEPTTAYNLAKRLGINYSTVRYHLDLLEKTGLVSHRNYGSKQIYTATRSGQMYVGKVSEPLKVI